MMPSRQNAAPAAQATGTHDATYNLVSVLYHISIGQKLVQNHQLKTLPALLADAVVPQRLVRKKGAKRVLGAVFTFNSPLQLSDFGHVGSAPGDNAALPR